MKIQKSSRQPVDHLLKQTLKDDLSPEMENRLIFRLRQFQKKIHKQEGTQSGLYKDAKDFFSDRIPEWKWERRTMPSAALAFAAAAFIVLSAAAILVPVTGSSSLLAESFSTMTTSLYVSQQISRVQAMHCSVDAVSGQGEHRAYSIRWTPGQTLVQLMNPDKSIAKTLLVEMDHVPITEKISNAVSIGNGAEYKDDLQFQPVIGFLTPADFRENLQGKWVFGSDRQRGDCDENTFSLVNFGKKEITEVKVDMCTFLPTRMIKYHPVSTQAGKEKEIAVSVSFTWETSVLPRIIDQKIAMD